MKIAFFEIKGWEKSILKKKLKSHRLQFFNEPLDESHLSKIKDTEILSIFIYSKITPKILKKLPKLKLIITRSTGYDHISLSECKKRKIIVCNRPSYGENTVAEHTFALILALSRKLYKTRDKIIKDDFTIEGLQGFDLEGKTLGVLGAGRIGKHVIRIARGFNMKVLVHDLYQDKFLAEQLNFRYVDFKTLLKKSDILTIHVPYTKSNHHLFNNKTFKLMKKGSILINTARGQIVDNTALLKALNSKKLAGAGLDVIEGEDLIKEEKQLLYKPESFEKIKTLLQDNEIIDKENVVFTPHIAFYSKEALERIIHNTIENIKDFEKGSLKKEYIVN